MARKRRPGEIVCRCGVYRFPHRFMGGRCDGGAWVDAFWEKNLWGACRGCVFYEADAGDGGAGCAVLAGRDRGCPELVDYIRHEGVRLYGVNRPPPKRMGWRR